MWRSLTLHANFELSYMLRYVCPTATEKQDHSIVAGNMHVIWALGQAKSDNTKFYQQDEVKYHGGGSQRGSAVINFQGQ